MSSPAPSQHRTRSNNASGLEAWQPSFPTRVPPSEKPTKSQPSRTNPHQSLNSSSPKPTTKKSQAESVPESQEKHESLELRKLQSKQPDPVTRPSKIRPRHRRSQTEASTERSTGTPDRSRRPCRDCAGHPRKPLKSRHELHAELMAAQEDIDWLEDCTCVVCFQPVGGRQLYCSEECRLRDLGSSFTTQLLNSPVPCNLFAGPGLPSISTAALRKSVSPSTVMSRRGSTSTGSGQGSHLSREVPLTKRSDSLSAHTESAVSDIAPRTPASAPFGYRAQLDPMLKYFTELEPPGMMPVPYSSSSSYLYDLRRPSKAARLPPVVPKSPASLAQQAFPLHRQHESFAVQRTP